MKQTILALAASAAFPLLAATETVLWPSDVAELKAQNDSQIKLLADGAMGVETGVKENWPGTRLDFKAGTFDLTPFGQIVISVSNTVTARKLWLGLKNGFPLIRIRVESRGNHWGFTGESRGVVAG